MTNNDTFKTYSHYYDLLYKDKDYEGEALYISDLLSSHGLQTGKILEFGSGTGKHGSLLATKGYLVHGIERSQKMINQSTTSHGFTCQQGDIATISLNHTFDAIISLFHVISYQTDTDQLRNVFANAAKHLKRGGLFIFDFWYSPAVFHIKPSVRIKRIADEHIEMVRIAEPTSFPNENRVDVDYTIYIQDRASGTITSFNETHQMRHFSLKEIELISSLHGFQCITAEEFQTKAPPDENTWGVCVILKRV